MLQFLSFSAKYCFVESVSKIIFHRKAQLPITIKSLLKEDAFA